MNPNEPSFGRLVKNNLVALGSAAVLTVYSAGYFRTRSAAQRFDAEDAAERRPVATAPQGVASTPVAEPAPPNSKPAPAIVAKAAPAPVRPTDSARALVTTAPATPATTPPKDSSSTTGAGRAADTTAQRADTVHAKQYKDGVYSGWGTSRHGDIQASVEIKDGRIISAYISGCYTRYSCSWISMLPPQVVARQSPEVDFVSGATQSTNAFYYAVVEALKLAK